MDALKAALEKRRKETDRLKQKAGVAVAAKGRKKFVRRGDLERARKAEYEASHARDVEADLLRKHKVAGAIDDTGAVASGDGADSKKSGSKKRRRDEAAAAANAGAGAGAGDAAGSASKSSAAAAGAGIDATAPKSPAASLPKDAVITRLRALGQPITYAADVRRHARPQGLT